MIGLSILEIQVIAFLIGAIFGWFYAKKILKNKLLGLVICGLGAALINYLGNFYVFYSVFLIPVYSLLGAWAFSMILKKI